MLVDPGLSAPETTFGTSPFRCRGLVYLGAIAFYDEIVPGGFEAVVQALPEHDRAFFQRTFVAAALFDALPIVPLSAAAAFLARMSQRQLVTENAQWVAQRDLNGAYRWLLKLASPQMVARRLPTAALRYFDFGDASCTATGPSSFEAVQRKIPMEMAPWLSWCVEGFVPLVLSTAGARRPVARRLGTDRDALHRGHLTASIRWEFTWD